MDHFVPWIGYISLFHFKYVDILTTFPSHRFIAKQTGINTNVLCGTVAPRPIVFDNTIVTIQARYAFRNGVPYRFKAMFCAIDCEK